MAFQINWPDYLGKVGATLQEVREWETFNATQSGTANTEMDLNMAGVLEQCEIVIRTNGSGLTNTDISLTVDVDDSVFTQFWENTLAQRTSRLQAWIDAAGGAANQLTPYWKLNAYTANTEARIILTQPLRFTQRMHILISAVSTVRTSIIAQYRKFWELDVP